MTETLASPTVATNSVYACLGGTPAIGALVDRFCALIDEVPEAHTVHRLHPESLSGRAVIGAHTTFSFHPPLSTNPWSPEP